MKPAESRVDLQTWAVLLSLTRVSSASLFILMNSFNTGLSSCTRNSFLVISIPRSRERMFCRMPSRDTDRQTRAEISVWTMQTVQYSNGGILLVRNTESSLVHKVQLRVEICQVGVFLLYDVGDELKQRLWAVSWLGVQKLKETVSGPLRDFSL